MHSIGYMRKSWTIKVKRISLHLESNRYLVTFSGWLTLSSHTFFFLGELLVMTFSHVYLFYGKQIYDRYDLFDFFGKEIENKITGQKFNAIGNSIYFIEYRTFIWLSQKNSKRTYKYIHFFRKKIILFSFKMKNVSCWYEAVNFHKYWNDTQRVERKQIFLRK